MIERELKALARQLLDGDLAPAEFIKWTQGGSIQLDDTTLDIDRRRRCGFPEVVYGEGKSLDSLTTIFQALLDDQSEVLATRVDAEHAAGVKAAFPTAQYNRRARTVRIVPENAAPTTPCYGPVAVVTAGTTDLPVAEEARETLDWMGVEVRMIHDVGVAGPHRLVAQVDQLTDCDAVVVIAGMEGALPSVVGGHVPCPVIAVPTSVGYGAAFGGIAALLGMLNSCAANVTVVNIDAGFKGGYIAGLIAAGKRRPA